MASARRSLDVQREFSKNPIQNTTYIYVVKMQTEGKLSDTLFSLQVRIHYQRVGEGILTKGRENIKV